ncbi:hypothetical protein OS189_16860 [Sulfitobacter sp. F26169L]|uniref:calcium-binding protein n=1 Tax=Sulfitobacter sp. F26169L TaxID=2996015 RepID=UPI00226102ED|nr:hypothetical protein [Sulfitobacter sp. F26169L]MCX7568015.1 hypothetical protein [Sulfitobacter sp. F26169L]
MDGFRLTGLLAAPDDYSLTGLSLLEMFAGNGETYLLAGSAASGVVNRIALSGNFSVSAKGWTAQDGAAVPLSGGVCVQTGGRDGLVSFDRMTAQVIVNEINSTGELAPAAVMRLTGGTALEAAHLNHFQMGGRTWLVGVDGDRDGISLYRLGADWTATRTASVQDTPKTHAAHVSDTVSVQVGGARYIVTASAHENGMSSYRTGSDGSLTFVDSIGTRDGLWSTGLSDLTVIETGGETYVIGVGTQSGTLAAVRINPAGVFFVADIEMDDRNSRFAGVQAVETFTAQGRDFVLVGGTDGGISMFELLPEGVFFHHMNAVQSNAWNIGTITEITAHVSGDTLKVFVAGAGDGGLAELSLPLADIGTRWTGTGGADTHTGTAGHDMIRGGAGNDRLRGGAGDDVIDAGTGKDRLEGGTGADVFVFTADGTADRIDDFQIGIDRIDLSQWGMLYDISALSISSRNDGARIRYQSEEIRIKTMDGEAIDPDMFSQSDFIF